MNRSLLLSTSLILIVLSSCALAQTVTVSPATVIPGEPLFVRVQGQFPTPCSLDVTQLETRVENQLLEVRLIIAEEPCPQVIAELDQSFGAFTLDADQFAAEQAVTVQVVRVESGEDLLVGSAEVTVQQTPVETAYLQPGMYWDPSYPGAGLAVEAQADALFLALYEYSAEGFDQWQAIDGLRSGNSYRGELLSFADGPCITCDPLSADSARQTGNATTVAIHFDSSASGFLATGDSPGPALRFTRFSLRTIESEGTIAGETFTFPDLTGQWLFTDTDDGSLHIVTDLERAPSNIADSGLAFFASPDRTVSFSCGRTLNDFRCELALRGSVIQTLSATAIGHDQIRSSSLIGVRLQ